MPKYLLFAFSDCKDPAREEEFDTWYETMHLPDMLEVPGMIKASRWISAQPEAGQIRKYLAMYELETDDLDAFDDSVRERGMRTVAEGRFSDLPVFDPHNVPRCYRQIGDEKYAGKND